MVPLHFVGYSRCYVRCLWLLFIQNNLLCPPCFDKKTDINWSFSMSAFVAVSLCKIHFLRRGATPVDSVRLPLINLQNLLGLLVLSSLLKYIRNIGVISSSSCWLRFLFDFLKVIPISYFSTLFLLSDNIVFSFVTFVLSLYQSMLD